LLLGAQLTTGIVEGALRDSVGQPASHADLFIADNKGFVTSIHTDSQGRFTLSLPYGRYTLSTRLPVAGAPAIAIEVRPLQTACLELAIDSSGHLQEVPADQARGYLD
jgi:hypothetical protein